MSILYALLVLSAGVAVRDAPAVAADTTAKAPEPAKAPEAAKAPVADVKSKSIEEVKATEVKVDEKKSSKDTVIQVGGAFICIAILFMNLTSGASAALYSFLAGATYLLCSVTIDVLIRRASETNGGKLPFEPMSVVIIVEVVKILASLGLLLVEHLTVGVKPASLSDCKPLLVPGFFYTINNYLIFVAIAGVELTQFGVLRETVILLTATLWMVVFKSSLGWKRWAAISLIFSACALNQVGAFFRNTMDPKALWVVVLVGLNSTASVSNEWALKGKAAMSINLQNIVLYCVVSTFASLILLVWKPETFQMVNFFKPFAPDNTYAQLIIIGQCVNGLLVSRLLKFATAVTKSVWSAIRAPSLVMISPLFTETKLDVYGVVSCLTCCAGTFLYLIQGPLQRGDIPAKGSEKATDATPLIPKAEPEKA